MIAISAKLGYFDWLRALSSQSVVVGHALNIFLPSLFMVERADGFLEAARNVPYIQNLGVVVFFALSGYLVTSSVVRKARMPHYSFEAFLVDRATRIFVPLLPAIALVWIFDTLLLGAGADNPYTDVSLGPWTVIANVLMIFNHPAMSIAAKLTGIPGAATGPIGTADPFWTVVLEWWIYVTFGLFVLKILNGRRLGFSGAALLLFALAPLVVSLSGGSGLILAWPVGMLVAIAEPTLRSVNARLIGATVVLAVGVAVAVWLRTRFDFYAPVFVVCFAYAMTAVVTLDRRPEPLAQKTAGGSLFVERLSDYSYSLYLVHFSILIYLQLYLPRHWNPVASILLSVVVCNGAAFGFWWLFERHYLNVRRAALLRLENSRLR